MDSASAALSDKHAGVRENAIRASESRLPGEIFESVLGLANDPDPRVRLQCAVSLGGTLRKQAISALVAIALRDANDRWTRLGVLSSIRDGQQFFHDFVEQARERTDGGTAELMHDVGRLLGSTLGSNTPPLLVRNVPPLSRPSFSTRALPGPSTTRSCRIVRDELAFWR